MSEIIRTDVRVESDDRITLLHRIVKSEKVVFAHSMSVDIAGELLDRLQKCLMLVHERHDEQLKKHGVNKVFISKDSRSHA